MLWGAQIHRFIYSLIVLGVLPKKDEVGLPPIAEKRYRVRDDAPDRLQYPGECYDARPERDLARLHSVVVLVQVVQREVRKTQDT